MTGSIDFMIERPSTSAAQRLASSGSCFSGVVVVVFIFEVVSALWLASLNPVHGYDENWYLINAHRMAGFSALPYAPHRPPLFPVVLSLMGEAAWLIPAISHIVATGVIFLLLRGLVSPGLTLIGVGAFVLSGALRMYNIFLLTEMPCVCLLLFVVYHFSKRRPLLVGAVSALLLMLHGSMVVVPTALLAVYVLHREWRSLSWCVTGFTAILTEFLIAFAMGYGNPLAPLWMNVQVQQSGMNDWFYYVRQFPQIPIPLILGVLAAAVWVVTQGHRTFRVPTSRLLESRPRTHEDEAAHRFASLCTFLLGVVILRMALLHAVPPKSERFLVPLVPPLLILMLLMMQQYLASRSTWRWVCSAVLLLSVLPGRSFYYYLHDLRHDPARLIHELQPALIGLSPPETVYTDVNDLAVMGATARPAVAVVGDNTWHHSLLGRPSVGRQEIPRESLYITWDPRGGAVLAESKTRDRPTLYLVRWRGFPRDGDSAEGG